MPRNGKDLLGDFTVRKMSTFRRLTAESFDLIPQGHHMMAMLEFDVTAARESLRKMRQDGKRVSLFAFLLKCLAVALAENPSMNSVRGRKTIVEFADADLNISVEIDRQGETTPSQVIIRKANLKSVEDIRAEIDEARHIHDRAGFSGGEDEKSLRFVGAILILPKFIKRLVMRAMVNNPLTVKRMSGTTFVTSVGSFGKTPGFVVPFVAGTKTASFAIGNVVRKPVAAGDDIVIREILSMTATFNHDTVDGAPAARFVNRLKKLIETPVIF